MSSGTLIDLSTTLEPWATVGAGAALVVLVAHHLFGGRGPVPVPSLDAPLSGRTERMCLVAVLVVAAGVRLVGWDSALTPVFWFSEISTLYLDQWLRHGGLWEVWQGRLHAMQVLVPHDSAIVLPVLAALQTIVGVRFGLPVLAGAFFGTLAVLLAWALGRRVRSQAFGLVFAALVACSPLAITWSRLSGFCTAAVAHVLLALVVGWEAGRRQSILLAVVAGAVAWGSVYEYYPARVSIPLALLAIVAGSQRSLLLRRGIVLALVAAATFLLIFHWLHGPVRLAALWPSYGGYAGNKGERTLGEFIARNVDSVVTETRTTIARYFATRRTGWESDGRMPGMQNGGLSFLAVGCLGLVGFAWAFGNLRRQWLWLVLAAAGLALPAFSVTTARRMLVFDLAWCAFAAHGLLAVVDGLGGRLSYAQRAGGTGVFLAALALWSGTSVFTLSGAAPATFATHIPFGEAGFGDGVSCKRCLEAAKGWQRDIVDGAFVVLFDNDAFRENRTSPGGLAAYGKIASLAAHQPGRFVEMYALMADWDGEPPAIGPIYDRARTSFARTLAARIEAARPREIVWHFERPTAWERWLATRLEAAGGTVERFATALSPRDGIRVTTPWARRAAALAVIDGLARGLEPGAPACFDLVETGADSGGGPVFLLGTADAGIDRPPDWVATSWHELRYRTYRIRTPSAPIGVHVRTPAAAPQQIEFLAQDGQRSLLELPTTRQLEQPPPLPGGSFGLDCGAHADGHWWIVEPMTGRIRSTHPAAAAVPPGAWIGVAAGPSGELVLASADQEIVIFDPARRTTIARFPARVAPTVRDLVDECTPVAVGADWIGIANLRTTVLSLYSWTGRDLGTRRLDTLEGASALGTIGGAGHHLGASWGASVHTFAVRVDPVCGAETTATR
jgi:hypothetical protein